MLDAGGTALLLSAQALARKDERTIARLMADARAEEYDDLTARAHSTLAEIASHPGGTSVGPAHARALRRLRKDLRAIGRRDYFPPAARDAAEAAISELAAAVALPAAAATNALAGPKNKTADRS